MVNIFLAIMMILVPKGNNSPIHKCIDFHSVFETDKEYNALDLKISRVSMKKSMTHLRLMLSSFQISTSSRRSRRRKIVLDSKRRKCRVAMSHLEGSLVGFLDGANAEWEVATNWKLLSQFKVIELRVSYSMMWYSLYEELKRNGAYRGAEEIDKCLIWLVQVSFLTAFLIGFIPGPCAAIKAENTEDSQIEV